MTRERAEQLLNKPVLCPNGWYVILRELFTDESGQLCGKGYTQYDGMDMIPVSWPVAMLEEAT